MLQKKYLLIKGMTLIKIISRAGSSTPNEGLGAKFTRQTQFLKKRIFIFYYAVITS